MLHALQAAPEDTSSQAKDPETLAAAAALAEVEADTDIAAGGRLLYRKDSPSEYLSFILDGASASAFVPCWLVCWLLVVLGLPAA